MIFNSNKFSECIRSSFALLMFVACFIPFSTNTNSLYFPYKSSCNNLNSSNAKRYTLDRLETQNDGYWKNYAAFINDHGSSRTGEAFPEENLDNSGWLTNDTITAAMPGMAAVRAGKETIETMQSVNLYLAQCFLLQTAT